MYVGQIAEQSVQWRKSPASVGDHKSSQLFLSQTKQRYLFAWKRVIRTARALRALLDSRVTGLQVFQSRFPSSMRQALRETFKQTLAIIADSGSKLFLAGDVRSSSESLC